MGRGGVECPRRSVVDRVKAVSLEKKSWEANQSKLLYLFDSSPLPVHKKKHEQPQPPTFSMPHNEQTMHKRRTKK